LPQTLSGIIVAVSLGALAYLAADRVAAKEHLGTHREQAARSYCWKRIGLDPDATPTKHQAARLKPCVKQQLGYDDPYLDQFE